jgi:hypothetical protein
MAIHNHSGLYAKFKHTEFYKRVPALIIVLLFGITGVYIFATSHAATPYVTVEAESGTLSGNATINTDSSASGGESVVFGGGTGASTPGSLTSFFPIGVYVQPTSNFALWKSRGINTLVDVPSGNSEPAWDAAAIQDGLYEIRAPASSPASDASDKNLLAWAQPDEPDGIDSQVPYSTIQSTYATWKAIDPSMNVYINFVGDLNQYDLTTNESGIAWYQKYAAGADWISADKYPVNEGEGNNIGIIGTTVDTLHEIAGTKPVFAFIESGNYNTTDGYPTITAPQFNGEVWDAIIHGVRGIWYFPEQITPSFAYDVTPAAVATQMTSDDATITALSSVLQGTINPTSIGATVSSPLQVAWRSASGQDYFFVLNVSASTENNQTINLSGIGSATSATVYGENRTVPITNDTITDSFAPYAVHIYEVE